MRKHIDLYVNEYSIDLGEKGRNAVMTLIRVYNKMHGIDKDVETLAGGREG